MMATSTSEPFEYPVGFENWTLKAIKVATRKHGINKDRKAQKRKNKFANPALVTKNIKSMKGLDYNNSGFLIRKVKKSSKTTGKLNKKQRKERRKSKKGERIQSYFMKDFRFKTSGWKRISTID